VGTCFTLFVVPAVYLLVARDRSRKAVAAPLPAPVPGKTSVPSKV
jgi:hypothetical protein